MTLLEIREALFFLRKPTSEPSYDEGFAPVKVTNPVVFIEVGTRDGKLGRIEFELFRDLVPKTANNFLGLITKRHGFGYHGSKFHRIIPRFMIQGGDFERGDGTGGQSIYGGNFEDENFELIHDRPGLLSMANSGPDTNGSQFFITLAETHWLDGKHVVFGEVKKGLDVVKKMERFGTEEGKPQDTIKIVKCGIVRY